MTRQPISRLARIQQLGLLLWFVAVTGWWLWPVAHNQGIYWAGWGLLLGGHAGILALELLIMVWVNRRDAAPRARTRELMRAWCRESWWALRVFAWQQPLRWRLWPDPVTAEPGSTAVVLVHGFVCNRGFWLPWLRHLHQRRLPYVTVNLEPVFGDIEDYVGLIESAVQKAHALNGRPPVLVGHSMGGLAIRAWLVSRSDAPCRVQQVITVGSPHAGTWLARWSHTANGRQMQCQGAWLQALETREREQRPRETYGQFTCWYSNTDNIVFPASTASLPGADNRLLRGAPHVGLAFEPDVLEDVIQCLTRGSRSQSLDASTPRRT